MQRPAKKEDEAYRPFSGINLKEKVTSIASYSGGRPAPRKSQPVVGGYQKDADFGDILAAFEAGEDVSSVSKGDRVKSRVEDNRSFADIFAEWEEMHGIAPKQPKPKKVEIKKSAPYKQTKDFGSILSQFEGKPAPKEAKKPSAPPVKKQPGGKPMAKSVVSSSGKSFGDLLAQFEGRAPKKPALEVKEVVAPPPIEQEDVKRAIVPPQEETHEALRRQLVDDGVKWAGSGIQVMMTDVAHQKPEIQQPETRQKPTAPSEIKSSGKSFGELLDQFYQAKTPKQEEAPRVEMRPVETAVSPFADLYKAWSDDHDENSAIEQSKTDKKESPRPSYTIGQLRAMLPLVTKDMHGLDVEEAQREAARFLADSWEHGVPKISIITGKGLHSQDGVPVVKEMVESVLHGSPYVREFACPKARYGGSGAIWIILKEKDR